MRQWKDFQKKLEQKFYEEHEFWRNQLNKKIIKSNF